MLRLFSSILAVALSVSAFADPPTRVDLRSPKALEELQRTNPAHFEKIRQLLAELEKEPSRAEGDWLKLNFDARDVALSRMVVKTSYPPKQVLTFRLDEVRYTMHVTRSDFVATGTPLQ